MDISSAETQLLNSYSKLTMITIVREHLFLTVIHINNNLLTELPPEIGSLIYLKRLNASHNRLTELPKEIGNLLSLIELNVSHNRLIELPKEIGLLHCLKYLYLSTNNLVSLPEETGNLLLVEITVDGNLLYPPMSDIVYTTRRIMGYIKTHSDTVSPRGRYKNMLDVINLMYITDASSMFDRLPSELLLLVKEYILSDPYVAVI